MKTIRNIFDFEKGDNFKLKSGATFEVVVSIKERNEFVAVCIDCEDKDKIGKLVMDHNFNGLNVVSMDDYIESATNEKGKELKLEREENENSFDEILKGIKIMQRIEENPNDKDAINEAYDFAKKHVLGLLKNDNIELQEKKRLMDNYKKFEDKYKEVIEEMESKNNEVEDFIRNLEEE